MIRLPQYLAPAIDMVLPVRCPACSAITRSPDGAFCSDCWQQLHFLAPPWCASCATPFGFDPGEGALCATCLAHPPVHDGVRAAVAYNDISRKVALRLKYAGKIGLADIIAKQLARHLPDDRTNILIVPVPLHWSRLWARSFNQSALIAQALADAQGIPYAPDVLLRTRRTPSLKGLSGQQRRKTVGNVFAVNPRWSSRLKGLRIILIDDVLTSGATSDGCIKALKKGGADWVQLFCWARVLPGEMLPEKVALSYNGSLDLVDA